MIYDAVIRGALILDGTGAPGYSASVGIHDGRIARIAEGELAARQTIDAAGLVLSPGFIDVHTHDDTNVIRFPEMLPKISQGVTTVIVGNCGICAAPVSFLGDPPDPMNLLGPASAFVYPTFASYRSAVEKAVPAVNVAALVGHTALRINHLDRLDRAATARETDAMKSQLIEALGNGALGLSTGLAYKNAKESPAAEVASLAALVSEWGGVYTTHMRTEFDEILDAIDEACSIGAGALIPVVISHLKCAGAGNWGRSGEVLERLKERRTRQQLGWDCYPYAAGSSTLDLKQVTDEFKITITWSQPHPEMGGRTLAEIAALWQTTLLEAAQRLQPGGAVYHNMDEADVRRILADPVSMIGSDGLPNDPRPHPRLWGAFPRVLGHYSRDQGLFPLAEAVRKMTGLSAARFGLKHRGLLREGYWADLVLFDPKTIRDTATFENPIQKAEGIQAVWVNGELASVSDQPCPGVSGAEVRRSGRFLAREGDLRDTFS